MLTSLVTTQLLLHGYKRMTTVLSATIKLYGILYHLLYLSHNTALKLFESSSFFGF